MTDKLLFVPLSKIDEIADLIGKPKPHVKIGMVAKTTRCGSTLIAQMMNMYVKAYSPFFHMYFQRIPKTRCMSEPFGLFQAHIMYEKGLFDMATYKILLKAMTILQFKVHYH